MEKNKQRSNVTNGAIVEEVEPLVMLKQIKEFTDNGWTLIKLKTNAWERFQAYFEKVDKI